MVIYPDTNCDCNRRYMCEKCYVESRGIKMIKLSNGVEISEDTVIASLKRCGIKVEPEQPPKVLLYGTTKGTDNDVYLKVYQMGDAVKVESVTKNGQWRKYICSFFTRGLRLNTSAEDAGFPVEGRMKKIKIAEHQ